jgi:hypothetical protein
MSEPAAHPVADHRAAHGAAHHESDAGRFTGRVPDQQVRGQQAASRPPAVPHRHGELRAVPHACLRGKHQRRLTTVRGRGQSGAQPGAPLAPARSKDRPPGAGAHAQAESVRPRATAIVRLKCTLAHFGLTSGCRCGAWLTPHRPGSRISTAPARWPVDQGRSVIPGGQTGAPARSPPGAGTGHPELRGPSARGSRGAQAPGYRVPCAGTGFRAAEASSGPAGYRKTAIYRTRRKRDA